MSAAPTADKLKKEWFMKIKYNAPVTFTYIILAFDPLD
jgi:hypothetical protein